MGYGTRYYNVSLRVFHNCLVYYAGSIWDVFWAHTCYFYLRVAGRVGPPPHLSLFTPGWGCTPLVASSDTVQGVSLPPSLHCSLLGCVAATLIPLRILLGCVAATLIPLLLGCVAATLTALLIARVCCCHPHSITYITRVCCCHPHSIITRVCRCHPYCSTRFWVCRCHPYCMHFMGCVAATLVLPQGAPNL